MRSTRASAEAATPLLELRGLQLAYAHGGDPVPVLRGVDLSLARGECLGVVGESGSGKSQLLLALLGLSGPGAQSHGSIRHEGRELLGLPEAQRRLLRGRRMGIVFQDALGALNPYLTIGAQLCEVLQVHAGLDRAAARARGAGLLAQVQVDEPERRLRQHPHELSGGQRQRVLLALALAGGPDLLLLDEPTTALDVTVQAQMLALLRDLRQRTGVAMLFVTHDLALLAGIADRVAVMYAGRIVEEAPATQLYARPLHPYTGGLLRSVARIDSDLTVRLPSIPGHPPEPGRLPAGCAFQARCPLVQERCLAEPPELAVGESRYACHREDAPRLQQEAWP